MNISSKLKSKIDKKLLQRIHFIARQSKACGLKAYLVGGMVRDLMIASGKEVAQQDCDVTITGSDISRVAALLAKKWDARLVSHSQFLTHTIQFNDGAHIDLVTARKESYAHPAALPSVEAGDLKSDLYRRDFTINAMASSLDNGEVTDLFNGLGDLKKKIIRVLHSGSFKDDPTRLFRAARYAGRFGFHLEETTRLLLNHSIEKEEVKKLSVDRIRTEIEKVLKEKKVAPILENLSKWDVLNQVHPSLRWNKAIQNRMAHFDDEKTMEPCMDEIVSVRLTYWLMDHSPKETELILKNLNFPKSIMETVAQNIALIRLFKNHVPVDTIAVPSVSQGMISFFNSWVRYPDGRGIQKHWEQFLKWIETKPILDGRDLKKMGYKPGPIFKTILDQLKREKFMGKLKNKSEEAAFIRLRAKEWH